MSKELAKLRAWWSHRQALDGRLAGAQPARVLAETGWARSVGGVAPYLTLFSRCGVSRPAVDHAAEQLELYELPAARGCTYVVPAADFELALKAAQMSGSGERKVALKLGVTESEIEKLCAAVLDALAAAPLEPEAIRTAVGSAARSLGEEGRRKGLSTTLPLALDELQLVGHIRRVPLNGRLDQQRYAYTRWHPNPLDSSKLSAQDVSSELARRYFSWIGPATLAEFQWFSALSLKAARAALQPLSLATLPDGRLLLTAQRDEFESFSVPKDPAYRLVSGLDALCLLRRDLKSLLDPSDLAREFVADKSPAALGSLPDLPSHAILDRGRIVGLWEYDPAAQSIVWAAFIPVNSALKQAVHATEEFVRTGLGDARSFSLDSPKSRAPRIAAILAASTH